MPRLRGLYGVDDRPAVISRQGRLLVLPYVSRSSESLAHLTAADSSFILSSCFTVLLRKSF